MRREICLSPNPLCESQSEPNSFALQTRLFTGSQTSRKPYFAGIAANRSDALGAHRVCEQTAQLTVRQQVENGGCNVIRCHQARDEFCQREAADPAWFRAASDGGKTHLYVCARNNAQAFGESGWARQPVPARGNGAIRLVRIRGVSKQQSDQRSGDEHGLQS